MSELDQLIEKLARERYSIKQYGEMSFAFLVNGEAEDEFATLEGVTAELEFRIKLDTELAGRVAAACGGKLCARSVSSAEEKQG